jgi:hypothetical protein
MPSALAWARPSYRPTLADRSIVCKTVSTVMPGFASPRRDVIAPLWIAPLTSFVWPFILGRFLRNTR